MVNGRKIMYYYYSYEKAAVNVKKKFPFDKHYIKISVYAFLVIAASIAFEKLLANPGVIPDTIRNALNWLIGVAKPFFYGFIIAYFLNAPVRFIERKLIGRVPFVKDRPKLKRALSALLIYVVVIGVLIWIIAYLVPDIVTSITNANTGIQNFIANFDGRSITEGSLQDLLNELNKTFSTNFTVKQIVDSLIEPIQSALTSIPALAAKFYAGTLNVAVKMLNAFLGIVISFYMLTDKDRISSFVKKLIHVIFKTHTAERILDVAKRSNLVFESFVVGKSIDATIMGTTFLLFAVIVKLPYAPLLALIVGAANMIPFFGPFIGGIPVILIVFMNNQVMGIWTAVFLIALQQFDGNILEPKILSGSTGLRPMAVIFSILVGGALFGIVGLFFGVPVFAVISNAIVMFVDKKYDKKISEEPDGAENSTAAVNPDDVKKEVKNE